MQGAVKLSVGTVYELVGGYSWYLRVPRTYLVNSEVI